MKENNHLVLKLYVEDYGLEPFKKNGLCLPERQVFLQMAWN